MRSWQAFVVVVGWLVGSVASPAWAELQWVDRAAPGPSPRCEFGFAYDSAREVAVLFGGSSDLSFAAVNAETWEWNGSAWARRDTTGPPARCDQAFAYDSARQRVVSFGGYNGTYLNDTWEWDGTGWTPIATPGPSPRADSFMAFDSARNVMVLFGGQGALGGILRDTWEYDGTAWTQRATGGPPPARWIQRMAFDRTRGVVVMYGGANPSGLLSDTWEWNGTSWTQGLAAGPPARYGNAMCFDVLHGRSVVYGGQSGFNFGVGLLGDTWRYDGTQWTELAIPGPSARTFVKMVYDEARRRAVVFGGWAGQPLGDTWELVEQSPVDVPAAKTSAMALAGFRPHPPGHELRVAFTLARSESTRLEILDVSGRRLLDRNLGVMSPGDHVVSLGTKPRLAPGVYVLRLSQGSQSVTARGVISK